ncbi:MAG TPA: CdaR family protein [Candidatus Binatia bacterium]|nr:CdaR family protein [Candidatus Binatia bacterium]
MKEIWEKIVALAGSNFGLKALALIIAVGLWLAGHRDIERAIEVPVEFRNIPADLMVMDNRVDYVVVRLMGPRTLVSTLDADDMKLMLDLNGTKAGSLSYPLSAASFNLPRGATIARITPPVVHLRLEPVVKRTLPVSVRVSGKPADGYRVSQTSVLPENVSVEGPAEDVRRLTVIETLPVDVEENRSGFKRRVRLSTDGKPLTLVPEQVDVSITVVEEQVSREFDRVQVRAKDFKGSYTVTPPTFSLRLSGPKSVMQKLKLTSDEVYLNIKGMSLGDHSVPLELDLPAEVKVEDQKPQRFKVKITKLTD